MPRVKTTPMVKAALLGLRIYLIVLLGLILLKFVRTYFHSTRSMPATTTSAPANPEALPAMSPTTFKAER